MTIGLCTDSNSQLPRDLASRYDIEVVPLTVTVDGVDYLEGVDLDADAFWLRFADGNKPAVATAQPSPGRIAESYAKLADRGATEILSIHVASALSGTFNAARLAADLSPVPVRLVDSGTASFGIACCVWAAAEAIEHGATIGDAARAAESLAPRLGNIFVVGALDLVRAGGRFNDSDRPAATPARSAAPATNEPMANEPAANEPALAVPLLSLRDGKVDVVGECASVDDAADAMATTILAGSDGSDRALNVAIGIADVEGQPLSIALRERLAGHRVVNDCVDYRVGPSVGAHTGPGTAGAFWFTARRPARR